MKPCILVAEDEPEILKLITSNLVAEGLQVIEALDGTSALARARRERPSLVILDLLIPGRNGLEVIRALKTDGVTSAIPVILLSARAQECDRIAGLEAGADDFVAKPFSPRELVLRARSILRRTATPSEDANAISVGAIKVDWGHYTTTVEGRPVPLTAMEFRLMLALAGTGGEVVSRESLLRTVWGPKPEIDLRTVDTHLRRLREKLGPAGRQIRTVRSFGYRLDES
ncbi:MAG: two-component system, OmpR family, phosphate regulon response regulator PhoB [Chthoniobacter sp.]|jgi:two-component system phosphate regulon response regulator PhoB|nr:two-component system, OmpR family, phosphate regulon response regulator PhoB [Chthoniobacter sp.]